MAKKKILSFRNYEGEKLELNEKLGESKKLLDETIAAKETLVTQLAAAQSAGTAADGEAKEQMKSLTDEMEQVKAAKVSLEVAVDEMRQKLDDRTAEATEKETKIVQMEEESKRLIDELAQKAAECDQKSAEIVEFATRLEEMVNQGDVWKEKFQNLERDSANTGDENVKKIDELRDQLVEAQADKTKLSDKLKSSYETVDVLTGEKTALASEFETFQSQVAQLNASAVDEKNSLLAKIAALTTSRDEATSQLSDEETKNAALVAEAAMMSDEIEKLKTTQSESNSKIEDFKSQKANDNLEISKLKADIAALSENVEAKGAVTT